MSSNAVNQASYLRTSREWPEDLHQLSVQLDKAYIEIANIVNSKENGMYAESRPSITAQEWFLQGNKKQQTFRQLYQFGTISGATNIPHLITTRPFQITKIYGTFTDGTNWYPLPYVDVTAANNQVNVIVTPVNIVITPGAGAPPTIRSGFVILEWLSAP